MADRQIESILCISPNGVRVQMESVGLLEDRVDWCVYITQYVSALLPALMFRYRSASWPPSLWS